jgi:Tol biopolymer transport system component
MPAEGGEPREIYSHRPWLDGSRFWGLAWTPDGRYLMFSRPEGSASNPKVGDLWRVPVAGGHPEKVGVAMNISRFPRVHPDGQRIAFESFDRGTFEVWALENFLPKLRASR